MFDKTIDMFDNYKEKMRVHKKKQYEAVFNKFMDSNRECFQEMFDYISKDEKTGDSAKEAASVFVGYIMDKYSRKGKLSHGMMLDLSLFMIYYVFPSIIKIGDQEQATLLGDAIRDEWRVRSGNKDFNYTTYEEIYLSFNEKIFGMF